MSDRESKDDIDSMLRALGLENFDYRDTGGRAQYKRLRLVKTERAAAIEPRDAADQSPPPAAESKQPETPAMTRPDAQGGKNAETAKPSDESSRAYTESLASVFSRLQATAPNRPTRKVRIDLHMAPRQADRQHTQDERVKHDLSQILSHLSGRSEGINRGQK